MGRKVESIGGACLTLTPPSLGAQTDLPRLSKLGFLKFMVPTTYRDRSLSKYPPSPSPFPPPHQRHGKKEGH
jgi:hypothetical protein